MNKRSNAIVLGGVVVALLGVLLVFAYSRSSNAETNIGSAGGTAFVTTTEIPVGTRWEDMTNLVERDDVKDRPVSAIANRTQLNGQSSTQALRKGQVVTTAQFTSPSGGLDIPVGQNAVTINLSVPAGVGRYVQAGATTNVYVSFKNLPGVTNPQDATLTKLLLSNIKVLANQPALPVGAEESSTKVVASSGDVLLTLALTPEQAERLIFAKENGSLWFGLVNPSNPPVTTVGRSFRSALI
jgi:pilus assembly protein CpaB